MQIFPPGAVPGIALHQLYHTRHLDGWPTGGAAPRHLTATPLAQGGRS